MLVQVVAAVSLGERAVIFIAVDPSLGVPPLCQHPEQNVTCLAPTITLSLARPIINPPSGGTSSRRCRGSKVVGGHPLESRGGHTTSAAFLVGG